MTHITRTHAFNCLERQMIESNLAKIFCFHRSFIGMIPSDIEIVPKIKTFPESWIKRGDLVAKISGYDFVWLFRCGLYLNQNKEQIWWTVSLQQLDYQCDRCYEAIGKSSDYIFGICSSYNLYKHRLSPFKWSVISTL